jgi:hypothetical protein
LESIFSAAFHKKTIEFTIFLKISILKNSFKEKTETGKKPVLCSRLLTVCVNFFKALIACTCTKKLELFSSLFSVIFKRLVFLEEELWNCLLFYILKNVEKSSRYAMFMVELVCLYVSEISV